MSKNDQITNKEEKQINDSMVSANKFKINQEDFRKKLSTINDLNKNSKDNKNKLTLKDKGPLQQTQQTAMNSLNPGKTYKVYTDQGNKNSILFQFRSEINRSQQIVDREVEKTINLKMKYNRKRVRTTELKMRSTFLINNNNNVIDKNPSQNINNNNPNILTNDNNNSNLYLNNNYGKFNFQNASKNLEFNNFNENKNNNSNDANSVSSKLKTETGFFKNVLNKKNNFFNTQIKIINHSNNKKNNNNTNNNSPYKNLIDSPSRANSQNINDANFNLGSKISAINQVNHFHSMANKTTGMLGLNSNSSNKNNDNTNINKIGFNVTSDYFAQGSKIISNRIKSYNIYFVGNWFEKNQIPYQDYTPHMVNNIEFQSNTIIDQLKVLLDNINHFKMQFLQGKNLVTIFKNLDPKRQVKYNKSIEETCGLLMEISTIILLDFTQYLEKFASIQPPNKDRLIKSEVKDEETNFFLNIKLFSDITVYLKGCFEVYLILIKQLDDMLLPYKTFIKLMQFLARARLGVSNLIFTAKNAFKNYCKDQSFVDKYFQVVLDINKQAEIEINQEMDEIETAIGALSKRSKINTYPRIPKTANFKTRMNNDDLSEKIRKQFMFRLNDDNQKIIRLNNVLNRKEYDQDNSFEKKKKNISKKMLQGSCLNSNLVTKLLKYCPKELKNKIISQRIIEMYKEKETEKN